MPIIRNDSLWSRLAALAVVLAAVGAVVPILKYSRAQRLIREAEVALAARDFYLADSLIQAALVEEPKSTRAQLVAGYVAAGLHESELALRHLEGIDDLNSRDGFDAAVCRAKRFLKLGRLSEAEAELRQILEVFPSHRAANEQLAFILKIEGRDWEARPFLLTMIKNGDFKGDELMMISSTEAVFLGENSQLIEGAMQTVPNDPTPLLGRARLAMIFNKNDEAKTILRKIVETHPNLHEAQGRLGQILAKTSMADFVEWARNSSELDGSVRPHPEVWYALGLGAENIKELDAAIRCYWDALRLNPDHSQANYRLSRLLIQKGERTAAAPFVSRAEDLARFDFLMNDIPDSVDAIENVVASAEALGRYWEAAGWSHVALRVSPNLAWAKDSLARNRTRIMRQPSMTSLDQTLAHHVDFSDCPLPEWAGVELDRKETGSDSDNVQFTFSDEAANAGITFQHYNGQDTDADRAYMFEFSGGGVGVIDHDQDGWSDIYFTQGTKWPVGTDIENKYQNRLYRNLGNGSFVDVTFDSGLGDTGMSLGAAVGDYNNDGFPDMYIANIGRNALYHNNGDGTFSRVESTVAGSGFTSSCLFADVNQDGHPDIYATNYLEGAEVFDRVCREKGVAVQCGPTLFEAGQDRLYLNLGDGSFRDVTQEAGIDREHGKGLGAVAGDMDSSGRVSLFVANDTTANFLFVNQTSQVGAVPRFEERASVAGVAVSNNGNAQACMGIAVDDLNNDGMLDLFVTNFYGEANNLFVQSPGFIFSDDSRLAGLYDPGFSTMGWGTQFLDADLDGAPELVVANGHINQLGNTPYRMKPQFYRNLATSTFAEVPSSDLGEYFQQPALARSLATIDWNRDGREDFCVTRVNSTPALVTNHTKTNNRFLSIRLVGRVCSRDAVGARITVQTQDRTRIRHLTSGSGFMASSHWLLIFGVGSAVVAERITVTWPSGESRIYHGVPTNRELLIIEGRADAFDVSLQP